MSWSNTPSKLWSCKSCMHQPCHSPLVFLHLSNLGCRLLVTLLPLLANSCFVTPFWLFGLLLVLRQPPSNHVMVLPTLPPSANTCFVTLFRNPANWPIACLETTAIKSRLGLTDLIQILSRSWFSSVAGYDSPIHQCLLLKTNHFHLTTMV